MKALFIILTLFGSQLCAQSVLKKTVLGNFKTISGKEIKKCVMGYRTLGKLNPDKSNAVIWPTWFTGKSDVIAQEIVPSLMDTTGRYIIVADALGNGVSSSPSNSPGFPDITIRDMVNAQYTLLTQHMGISHLKAVIGISMGGMQALEWMIAYPSFADKVISIVGTPQLTSYDLMLWKSEAALLTRAENNPKSKESAMQMVSNVHLLNIYTPSYWYRTFKPEKVDSLMQAQQASNIKGMKPNDWLCQLKAMIGHDIYKSSGKSLKDMKGFVQAKVLMVVSKSDHLVNPNPSVELSDAIGGTLLLVDNDCGHVGHTCEQATVKTEITRFLR